LHTRSSIPNTLRFQHHSAIASIFADQVEELLPRLVSVLFVLRFIGRKVLKHLL